MPKAAGALLLTSDKLVLFLKRGSGGDHPGEWCFPGGHTDGDESANDTAVRETKEETGFDLNPESMALLTRSKTPVIAADPDPSAAMPPVPTDVALPGSVGAGPAVNEEVEEVDFTTFLASVDAPFMPKLSDEHTAWAWAKADSPPEPLHPGCRVALARLSMDELDVARAMVAGQLISPQFFENMYLWDMRITGTGFAYRHSMDEFVWRDPSLYLNQGFLDRCNGLIVIVEHPERATLDS